jgi:hypothetical protein
LDRCIFFFWYFWVPSLPLVGSSIFIFWQQRSGDDDAAAALRIVVRGWEAAKVFTRDVLPLSCRHRRATEIFSARTRIFSVGPTSRLRKERNNFIRDEINGTKIIYFLIPEKSGL